MFSAAYPCVWWCPPIGLFATRFSHYLPLHQGCPPCWKPIATPKANKPSPLRPKSPPPWHRAAAQANRAPYWQFQTCPASPIAPPFAKHAPHLTRYRQRFSPASPPLRHHIARFPPPPAPSRAWQRRFFAHPPSSCRWRASPPWCPTPNHCCHRFAAPKPAQGLWFAPCLRVAAKPYPPRAFRHAPPK